MKKTIIRLMISFIIFGIFSGCSKNSSSSYTNPPTTSSTSNLVSIAGMQFIANTTNISTGTTVTWTNNDDMIHTVTADDNSFTSGNLNKGDTYSHTFSSTGAITYHCKVHPAMTASVIVK